MILLILKLLPQSKTRQKSTKILIFTILDTLQLKKIGDCYDVNSVNPLYLRIL